MLKIKKAATAVTAAVATIGLAACNAGSSDSSGSGSNGGSLTVALTGPPANLDFTTTAGAAIPQALMGNVYESLLKLNQEGELEPLLAKEWKVSEDRKKVTFTLEPDVKFSNGEDFTADDVKFSLERVQSDAWSSGMKHKMDVVDKVTVNSDTEVEVALKRPSNAWLYDMTTHVGAMFDESGVDDLGNTAVGTGPFEVEVWKPNEEISFKARGDYWGDGPKLEKAKLKYFSEATATTNALKSGDVDVVYNLQAPALLKAFENDEGYEVHNGESTGKLILSMNNRLAPFKDKKVRQAVLYAIDRKGLMDAAWHGNGTLVGSPVAPSDPYYEDHTDKYQHDPQKAKELLKEAGAENIDITFTVPTRPYAAAVSEIVVDQLKEVGINAKIKSSEFPAKWLEDVFNNHDYEMSIILAVEQRDLLTMFNDPDYYIGYDNSKIKDLASKADAADEDGYIEGMKEIVDIITDDAPVDTLFVFPNTVITRSGVSGIPMNAVTDGLFLGDAQTE